MIESKASDLSGWSFVLVDDKKLDWTGSTMKTRQRKLQESKDLKVARVT